MKTDLRATCSEEQVPPRPRASPSPAPLPRLADTCPSGHLTRAPDPAPASRVTCPSGHLIRAPDPLTGSAPASRSTCLSGHLTAPTGATFSPAIASRPACPSGQLHSRRLARLAPLLLAAGCWSGPDSGCGREAADPDGERPAWASRAVPGARSDMPPWSGAEDQPASAALTGGRPRPAPESLDAFTMIDPTELRHRLWTEPPPPFYAPPTRERAAAFAELMRGMLTTPTPEPEALAELAFTAGYEVHAWYVSGQKLLAAVEPATRQTGGGAYLVRVEAGAGPVRPVILQAPHAFHDLGTERIALALALRGGEWPRALFVNTVHRYLDTDGERRERDAAPADPCHNPDHLFSVATAAALDAMPRAEVVQIHGFSEDDDPLGPAIVVSAGDRVAATARTREVAGRLRTALGVDVAVFPEDRTRLGATANAQGRMVRARGGAARFVHLELSHDLRRRLQRDARALASLADALRPDDRDPTENFSLTPPDRPL